MNVTRTCEMLCNGMLVVIAANLAVIDDYETKFVAMQQRLNTFEFAIPIYLPRHVTRYITNDWCQAIASPSPTYIGCTPNMH